MDLFKAVDDCIAFVMVFVALVVVVGTIALLLVAAHV